MCFQPRAEHIKIKTGSEVAVCNNFPAGGIRRLNPGVDSKRGWKVGLTHIHVLTKGAVQTKRARDFAIGESGAVYEGAVVAALDIERIVIARPPMNKSGRRRDTWDGKSKLGAGGGHTATRLLSELAASVPLDTDTVH